MAFIKVTEYVTTVSYFFRVFYVLNQVLYGIIQNCYHLPHNNHWAANSLRLKFRTYV